VIQKRRGEGNTVWRRGAYMSVCMYASLLRCRVCVYECMHALLCMCVCGVKFQVDSEH
jgi:hypothetical protein